MAIGVRFLTAPRACSYLPAEQARLEYNVVARLTPEEYQERMDQGWRRFGRSLFRPSCPACRACRPLRVDVARFRPDRSQRRAWKGNAGAVRLEVGAPGVSRAKLALYDRYHAYQARA